MNEKKKAYEAPELVQFGSLSQLTKSVATSGANDPTQGQNNLKTG